MFRRGDLKFLKILTLKTKSIKTSLRIKNNKKKVEEEPIKGRGSSVGLKVSNNGKKLSEEIIERIDPRSSGIRNITLLGEKFGTTDEI